MAKASKLEMLERERLINELISRGESRNTIIQHIANKYKIAERNAERQYYQILKNMSERLSDERELIRMEIAKQLEEVQRRATEAGANKVVIEAAMSRAKLLGLNEKVEQQVEKAGTIIFKEKDMGKKLEVVPDHKKAENE